MNSQGFTLIEIIVVVVIVSILTFLGIFSLPISRDHQRLVADTNQLQLLFREAERRAVNEVRPIGCLELAGGDEELERNCSDVGLAFRNRDLVKFSDINGNRVYDEGSDFVISEATLFSSVSQEEATDWNAITFVADPPNVAVYWQGVVLPPDTSAELTLYQGTRTRTLRIFPLRHVDQIEDGTL